MPTLHIGNEDSSGKLDWSSLFDENGLEPSYEDCLGDISALDDLTFWMNLSAEVRSGSMDCHGALQSTAPPMPPKLILLVLQYLVLQVSADPRRNGKNLTELTWQMAGRLRKLTTPVFPSEPGGSTVPDFLALFIKAEHLLALDGRTELSRRDRVKALVSIVKPFAA